MLYLVGISDDQGACSPGGSVQVSSCPILRRGGGAPARRRTGLEEPPGSDPGATIHHKETGITTGPALPALGEVNRRVGDMEVGRGVEEQGRMSMKEWTLSNVVKLRENREIQLQMSSRGQ